MSNLLSLSITNFEHRLICASLTAPSSANSTKNPCLTVQDDAVSTPYISSGWSNFLEYGALSKNILPREWSDKYHGVLSPSWLNLYGKASTRQFYSGTDDKFAQSTAGGTTQHAVVVDVITSASALWFMTLTNVTAGSGHGAPLRDQSDAIHSIGGRNYQPFVTTYCSKDTISDIQDERPLVLPLLRSANDMSSANANITG